MKIEFTDFNSHNYGWTEIENRNENYIIYNYDVFNEIIIDDKKYSAVYQTGCKFIGNDYELPSPALELSIEGGAADFSEIDDIDEIKDALRKNLAAAREYFKLITT